METRTRCLQIFCMACAFAVAADGAGKQPAGWFDVTQSVAATPSPQPLVLHQFRASSHGLYFGFASGPHAVNGFVLHTDIAGTKLGVVTIPPELEVHDLDVDPSGRLSALAISAAQPHLLTYNPSGALESDSPLAQPIQAICQGGGSLRGVMLGETGATLSNLSDPGQESVRISLSQPRRVPILLCTAAGGAVLVERTGAVVHLVNPQGGVVFNSPQIPEMGWLTSIRAGQLSARNVAFSTAAVSPEGDVFVTLGHFKLAEGAVVLRLDAQGSLVSAFRCLLPQFPGLVESNNPQGFMTVEKMGVAGPWLFLVSGDGKVAFYSR